MSGDSGAAEVRSPDACPPSTTYCAGQCFNTDADDKNCGGCGIKCDQTKGFSCTNGKCTCVAQMIDCGGTSIDVSTDPKNCGGCGECPPALPDDCSGTCVDLQQDPKNCGACNSACASGKACISGQCV